MSKRTELKFENIKSDFLSPGDIYWKQTLVSALGDMINFELIEKLQKSGATLFIENNIDFAGHDVIINKFNDYVAEENFREKMKIRRQFNKHMQNFYISSAKPQFDLNRLCWKLFSEIDRDTGSRFLNRDRDFFKRSMCVASSYTICAFLLGHYDVKFLKKLFNGTLINHMELGKDQMIISMKEKLEELRVKTNLEKSDRDYVQSIVNVSNFEQSFLFEKFNGSGLLGINVHEMTDLELILCSLNYYYHFDQFEHKNILAEIYEGSFTIDLKLRNLIKKNFEFELEADEESAVA